MSIDDELKWMTPRKSIKYIPNRYQALVTQIVAALLFFNLFKTVFMKDPTGNCGSLMRPWVPDEELGTRAGWIFSIFGGGDLSCPQFFYTGLMWEFVFTLLALAVCGVVLRETIKRMPSEHREATKDL